MGRVSTARLEIAYDGQDFVGWASQPGQRSVQAELEGAIERITGEHVSLAVAGRTDAGVHALAQVASFDHEGELPEPFAERLNAILPRDVAVRSAGPAPDGFDARRDAIARAYRYRLLVSPLRDPFEEGRALWWRHPLDVALLEACAAAVVGEHDFTAFTPTQTDHVLFRRTVNLCAWEWERTDLLVMRVEAPSFMRSMVRVLVGTMLEVATGRRSVEDFAQLLEGAPRERAGETAPAHGLYLVAARY